MLHTFIFMFFICFVNSKKPFSLAYIALEGNFRKLRNRNIGKTVLEKLYVNTSTIIIFGKVIAFHMEFGCCLGKNLKVISQDLHQIQTKSNRIYLRCE